MSAIPSQNPSDPQITALAASATVPQPQSFSFPAIVLQAAQDKLKPYS